MGLVGAWQARRSRWRFADTAFARHKPLCTCTMRRRS